MRTPWKWLHDDGLFGFNYWHLLRHPYIAIKYSYLEVKWFIQRGYRGYADCDTWDLVGYLNGWVPKVLRLQKDSPGIPGPLFKEAGLDLMSTNYKEKEYEELHETWRAILEEMALGFEAAKKMHDFEWESPEQLSFYFTTMRQGLSLFAKYYLNLWN